MTLDALNGIISGISPSVKGEYPMIFSAKNSEGKVSRNLDQSSQFKKIPKELENTLKQEDYLILHY